MIGVSLEVWDCLYHILNWDGKIPLGTVRPQRFFLINAESHAYLRIKATPIMEQSDDWGGFCVTGN